MKYEYQCQACANQFMLDREIDDRNNPAMCPKCQHTAYRLLSEPYVHFHGDGFTRGSVK